VVCGQITTFLVTTVAMSDHPFTRPNYSLTPDRTILLIGTAEWQGEV